VRTASLRIAFPVALVICWLIWATSPIATQIRRATASRPLASSVGAAIQSHSRPRLIPRRYSAHWV
jgi:hypothetical protein